MSGTTLSVSVEHITTDANLLRVEHAGGVYSVRIVDVCEHEPYLTVWLVGTLDDLAESLRHLGVAIAKLTPFVEVAR